MNKYCKYVILFLILIGSIIFMNNNYNLYSDTIVKVTDIKVNDTREEYNNNLTETYKDETVYVKVMNGEYNGQILSFENEESSSHVYDNYYDVGDEIFVKLTNNGKEVHDVINLRRDKYLVPLFIFLVCLLILVGSKKGLNTFFSLCINVFIIWTIIYFRGKGSNIFYLFLAGSILMTSISLLFTSGFNRKTMVAIISSLSSLIITFGLSYLFIQIFNRSIPYWYMEYVDTLFDYENVFLSATLISGLGAIMDISITVTSTLNEIISNNPRISDRFLKKSGIMVSSDVMGTMINVLFFTTMCDLMLMILYVMRNGMGVITSIKTYGVTDLIIFLTSALGILVAIPVSLYFSLLLLRKRRAK